MYVIICIITKCFSVTYFHENLFLYVFKCKINISIVTIKGKDSNTTQKYLFDFGIVLGGRYVVSELKLTKIS